MILTVTLNTALDLTYEVDSLTPHGTHRVRSVAARAGGKGINVARVLHQQGEPVCASGLVGGAIGAEIVSDLERSGLEHKVVTISASSRRTVSVVALDEGDATVFNEPGPQVKPSEWVEFLALYDRLARDADVVVCSGSLPGGLGTDTYADLVARTDAPVIVDCEGRALLQAAAAGATILKPNLAELRATTGMSDPVSGGRVLLEAGAEAVVVSLGPDGLLGLTGDHVWHADAGVRLAGNPTGAGDACVAALGAGLQAGSTWPDRLRTAVAWSAGAVVAPLAGDVDDATCRQVLDNVNIEESHATDTNR